MWINTPATTQKFVFYTDNEDKKETSTKVQDGVQDDFPTVVSAEAKG